MAGKKQNKTDKKSKAETNPEAEPAPEIKAPPPFTGNPKALQDALIDALEFLQQKDNPDMRNWAKENPTEFYKMAARLIPVPGNETSDALAPITLIEIIHTYEDERK